MNCYLYGLGPADARQWLMVDLGITFPEGENDPGVDVILPDLRFIEEERGATCRHRADPRARGPHRRRHRAVAAAQGADLCHPVHGGDAQGQARGVRRQGAAAHQGGGAQQPLRRGALRPRAASPWRTRSRSPMRVAIRTPHGLVAPHRRLEDRRHAADRRADRRGAPQGAGRGGRDGDDLRFHQRAARGPLALASATSRARSPSIIKGAKRRVVVTIFASNVARIRAVADAAERRPPARGGGPGHAPRHRRRHGDGLSADQLQVSRPGALLLPRARRGGAAVHGQPGRAARGAGAHRRRHAPRTSSSARATSSSSPRAPSPATSARSAASRTGWSISAATSSPTATRWCT